MWEPLPLIVYGYAIHPLTPSRRETRLPSRSRLSTVTEASTESHAINRDVVLLEVGDEVYAFEKYTPSAREPVEGVWYRGQVLDLISCLSLKFSQICRHHNSPSFRQLDRARLIS
jgi:dedicator of cytokinesis protein 3